MKTDGFTITAHCRPKYSLGHNFRKPEYVESQKHIDASRSHLNEYYLNMGDEEETYNKVFGQAVENYNKNQKRKERRITNYYQKVLSYKNKGNHKNPEADSDVKPFYEFDLYIGNSFDRCPDDVAKKVLRLFSTKVMPKLFPNFIATHIALHNDEYSIDRKTGARRESPVHIHMVGILVAHRLSKKELKEEYAYREKKRLEKKKEVESKGEAWDEKRWKKRSWRKEIIARYGKSEEKGVELRASLTGACNEMGYYTERGKGTAQTQFEQAVRFSLMDFAEEMGLKVFRGKGQKHSHYTKELYKLKQDAEALAEEVIKSQELMELEKQTIANKKDDLDYWIENIEDKQIEQDLKEVQLNSKERELSMNEEKQEELKQRLNDKESDLDRKDIELFKKNNKLNQKEQELNDYRKVLDNLSDRLDKREEKIIEGEKPYLEIAKAQKEKQQELNIQQRSNSKTKRELESKEHLLNKRQEELDEKEKTLNEQEKQIKDKVRYCNELKSVNEKYKIEIDNHLQQIEQWKDIIESNKDTEPALNEVINSFLLSSRSDTECNSFRTKILNVCSAAFKKVKNIYEKTIKQLKRELNGYDKYDSYGNSIHVLGANEINAMFYESTPNTLRDIANEIEVNNCNNFDELSQRKPNIFRKFFKRAREIFNKNERENGYSR